MSKEEMQFDAILAFPFGSKVDPLSANWHIALRAATIAMEHQVPLVVHEQVPIKSVLADLRSKGKQAAPSLELINGKTICDIANSFYSFAGWETWKNILIIAMPIIGKRCIRDVKMVSGEERFQLRLEVALAGLKKEDWFSEADKQFLARHPIICCLWELALCGVPQQLYRKFATSKK